MIGIVVAAQRRRLVVADRSREPQESARSTRTFEMHGRRATAGAALLGLTALAACGGGASSAAPSATAHTITIGLNVPLATDAYVAVAIQRGASLAVREANATGVAIAGGKYTVALKVYDDQNQQTASAQNVSSAARDGAVAVVEDGLGAAASAPGSAAAGIPEIVILNGTTGLADPQTRPSVFRLGIANDAAATLLGTYTVQTSKQVAIIHDDSASGRDGANQLAQSVATAGGKVTVSAEAPAAAAIDAPLHSAVSSGAGALAVWGGDLFVAKVVTAVRLAHLTLPIVTGPAGESPAVRATAGSAATDGLRFVSSRLTSEADATSFGQFESRLASADGGPTDAGFKDNEGREIRQPDGLELFAYDAVNLVVAALEKQDSAAPGQPLLAALGSVSVRSANGDPRGFNPQSHEGVSDGDLYIAAIHDMKFAPVQDEPLSKTLPTEDQVLAEFR